MARNHLPFCKAILAVLVLLFSSSAGALQGSDWDEDGGYTGDYSRVKELRWMGPDEPGTYEEYLRKKGSAPFQAQHVYTLPGARGPKALVLVNTGLYGAIQAKLTIYAADLAGEGYQVEVYQTSGGKPADLKAFILSNADSLAGCVFVGDQPAAWYEMDGFGYEQFPCDLFYMDLDGAWTDSDGDGRYDGHDAGTGDEGPEIFIGHIDASMMTGDEAALTSSYLDKVHAYRTGAVPATHYGLTYTEDDWADNMGMRTAMSKAYPLFDDIPAPLTERNDYLQRRVPNPEYEFIQLSCHSSPSAHYFTRGGTVANSQIKAAGPRALFYNLFCCSTLRYTSTDFLGGSYIYNDSQISLAVIGSTKTGSMLSFHFFYTPFGAYETFGESFRRWFNALSPYNQSERSWHYGMTVAGDPFLALRKPALEVQFPEPLPRGHLPPGPETRILVEIRDGREALVPGSEYLHYRFDPGVAYTPAALTPLGGDLYEAVLPHTRPGDEPEYYFAAQGDGGTAVFAPVDGPDNPYTFQVAFAEVLLCDDFDSGKFWAAGAENLTSGRWEIARPGATAAQPGDDHSPNGSKCYVTGMFGGGVSDDDVDGDAARLKSPVIDLSEGDAEIQFYLWFYHSAAGAQQPLTLQITNTGGKPWTHVADITHNPEWQRVSIKVSDHVAPTGNVKVRLNVFDGPDDDVVEALIDDFVVGRFDYSPSLWADAYALSAAAGGAIHYSLDAGPGHGSRPYLLLGSVTGTVPGTPLPGGAVLPLNWDAMTEIIMGALGTPVFQDFTGGLDTMGKAEAILDTFGPLDPAAAGLVIHFAFFLAPSPFFASNAITVTVEP